MPDRAARSSRFDRFVLAELRLTLVCWPLLVCVAYLRGHLSTDFGVFLVCLLVWTIWLEREVAKAV